MIEAKKIREKITLDNIINLLLYVVIVVMPLLMVKVGKDVFTIGKVRLLYGIGILLLIIGTVIFIRKIIKKEYINFNIEIKIALLFLFTFVIATLVSECKPVAILGNPLRKEGLIMYAIYILLFILSSYKFKINYKIIKIVFIIPCLVSMYGVYQYLGISYIEEFLFGKFAFSNQAKGTIGNANFFATYVCLFLFLSTSLYVLKKEMIYFIYSLILFIGLIASQTRGGWLGYFVYLLALVFILFTNKNSLNRKECLKRVFALIIIFIVGFSVLSFSKGDNAVEKASISNISDSKGTVAQRLEIYRLCFKLISDNPFLGNGPDSLAYSLNKSYPEEFKEYIINHNVYIDKAHNELIEYAACEGILTVVLYLALLAIICFGLYKNIRNGINVDINIVILLAIIGYFVQSQSNISVIQVAPLFWILLGFASKVKNAKCNILTK